MTWVRLLRACIAAQMTVRETFVIFLAVRRGSWEARSNREALAQAHYFRLLIKSRGDDR